MKKSQTINPFQYGKVVEEPYFIDREKELRDIKNTVEAGNNLILYAPRRYGKTSLIKKLLNAIDSPYCAYIDLYRVNDMRSFIRLYSNIICKTQNKPIQDILKKVRNLLKSFTPSVSFDEQGNPTWSFQFKEQKDEVESLNEVLDLPHNLITQNQRFYVIFDEFQEISSLNGEYFEKQLRSAIQFHTNVSYIFMGSKTHLMLEMFNSKNKALYKSGKLYSLGKIEISIMKEFLINRFKETSVTISDEVFDNLLLLTNNIPYYNQFLAAQLWDVCREFNHSEQDLLNLALQRVLENQNDYYVTLYENLTLYQRRVLEATIRDNKNIFSKEYSVTHKLSTTSSTQRAIEALVGYGIIEKEDKSYQFSDPFFSKWLILRNYA